ncbi:hypothetical protein VN97_g7612 [Penicillium thymicola]|uniref:Uncharacterized protein n=1 Tax=Penicillium thymicola TaxID=293382 RepID=A0AAI9TEX8_PENTH|nr:hypothetical protein VN97_g7612 [Penicillium thymicola]
MTTRNLNRTWRDVVRIQYTLDVDADVPFPLQYIIHAPEWNESLVIDIPNKVPVETIHRSISNFVRETHRKPEPTYQDEKLSIRARIRQPNPFEPKNKTP